MRLLVTGFEPFAGSPVNPSQQLAQALAEEPPPGLHTHALILPVDGAAAPGMIVGAIESQQPDLVIMMGQATGRAVISLERVAINLLDYAIPDNTGAVLVDQPVVAGGPAAYFATLPLCAMLDAMRQAGVPGELSLSAGAYLCNQVLYAALHCIACRGLSARAGFVHLPALPEQVPAGSTRTPSMSLATMQTGVRAAIAAAARQPRSQDI